ncbi:LacI family DNA-binding transcriptional regulator [Halalkalibacterium halodurans]|uniref:Transcriptional regulator involved in carbon catabolite control n=1 Tax=Halalkalibacterium halodurans (strain ATCC BAA-125 / DSM 18197 / FERM 7344 / JCM 9153 / C-125) TaxID=272558 RepID=Q9K8T0_HALH5|nr:LacI family DNA-binding transcriptional regulator [Halalkalibacterium halodurans]MED4126445.1 LacI family DNA-binding transcriptional regulator [Halalkalibacterium halodurans]MED4174673.1 LacI family DNA-binding transcriptional regulator [Halalkalibacterium halodurans]BAB06642.1 transcriptional regulator involved in carbon catabolite control [Halalkalibacterium halodurans C-125]
MAVTIKDVAKLAKVAPSTVSRVIANNPRISQRTKERVREAMEQLGYYPNYNARSLVNQSTKTLGIIIPSSARIAFQNPFFPEVIRGITTKAYVEKYGLYLSTGQTEEELLAEVKEMVQSRRVDGILLLYAKQDDKVMPYLIEENFPFVLVGRPYDDQLKELVSFVNNDNVKAAKMVTEYILLLGHRKIGFIGGNLEYTVTIDHKEGYRRALANAGIPFREEYVVYYDEVEEGGQEAVIELMSLEEPPTALIVADDLMALGVLRMLDEMDVSVPEEMSIISFNNAMISELSSPPLTTVDIHIFDLGFQATECLIEKMKDPERPPAQIIIPHKLIKRQTCRRLLKS